MRLTVRPEKKPSGNFGFKILSKGKAIYEEFSTSYPSREMAGAAAMAKAHYCALESGETSIDMTLVNFQPQDSDY